MSVDPVPVSGCPWPVDPACFEDDWDVLEDDVKARSIGLASATLRRLTGYRVGGCPITVRPCKRSCLDGFAGRAYYDMQGQYAGSTFYPHIEDGLWVNSCGCSTDCSCGVLCEVRLPGPVGRVDEVKVDGAVIEATNYRLDGDRLVWIGDTVCPWTACQDMSKSNTEVGTFSVTYLNSYPVDTLGAYAAGILAMEFARACTGNKKCRLPTGTSTVSRQGVSYDIVTGTFPGGVTGIREVDAYLALWNPKPIRQASKVWSPDLKTTRVTG